MLVVSWPLLLTLGNTLIVAPNGSADGDGSQARPLTLHKAIAALHGRAAGTTVLLRGGDYPILGAPVTLNSSDSGAPGNPVTYASFPGERAPWLWPSRPP